LIQVGRYTPNELREVDVPRGDGRLRRLFLPTVAERLVFGSAARLLRDSLALTRNFRNFYDGWGRRGIHELFAELSQFVNRAPLERPIFIVEADVVTAFDSIRVDAIEEALREIGISRECVECLGSLIRIQSPGRPERNMGVPQGNPLSSVLFEATIWRRLFQNNPWDNAGLLAPLVYVDNIIVHGLESDRVTSSLAICRQRLAPAALALPERIQVSDLRLGGNSTMLGNTLSINPGNNRLAIQPSERRLQELREDLTGLLAHGNPIKYQRRFMLGVVRSLSHVYLTMGHDYCNLLLKELLEDSEIVDQQDNLLRTWRDSAERLQRILPYA
jgi:hypothetical protein